ncbi:MAG: lamin tail domain-containing protein [Sphingobacteriaceae bacterium]|nr:MAG: hypothetical protein E6Q66_08940 [Pedobacter sp.]
MKNNLFIGLLCCTTTTFSQTMSPANVYRAKVNDVVINEIGADPKPPVALPQVKFIELRNNTDQDISLKGWALSDERKSCVFKNKNDHIQAGGYLIICDNKNVEEWKKFGRAIGLPSSLWPSPNGTEDKLTLKDENGVIISQVDYEDTWYKDQHKKKGGWTLERIYPEAVCYGMQNWAASLDASGGTPGRENSYARIAMEPLKITEVTVANKNQLLVSFNKDFDLSAVWEKTTYRLNHGIGHPEMVKPLSPYSNQIELYFKKPIPHGQIYQIEVPQFRDCLGNPLTKGSNTKVFTFTKPIDLGDILISEILFDPRAGGVEFVEIYNHSSTALDLKELSLATVGKDTLNKLYPITNESILLHAGKYMVLSVDPNKIKQQYHVENPDAFLKMKSFPKLNNKMGSVVLISNTKRIDQMSYSEDMHMKLIKEGKGVSLERSSFSKGAQEPGNFRSASSLAGFATPGYQNSQYLEQQVAIEEKFWLTSKTFSPNDDDFEDKLLINYHFSEAPGRATIRIFNERGSLVKELINNQTLSVKGVLVWDGLDERNQKAPVGIYRMYTELVDLQENVNIYRHYFVLAANLD